MLYEQVFSDADLAWVRSMESGSHYLWAKITPNGARNVFDRDWTKWLNRGHSKRNLTKQRGRRNRGCPQRLLTSKLAGEFSATTSYHFLR